MMPGEKIMDIAELSPIWVIADVYEYELANIPPRHRGRDITLAALPGKTYKARVDYIYPALSAETRTAKVRLVMPNPSAELKPEMYANVEFKTPTGKALAVPVDAVIDTGLRSVVYADMGNGVFELREVKRGAESEGMVEILTGLKEGERVAAAGAFLIDSEARLRGIVK